MQSVLNVVALPVLANTRAPQTFAVRSTGLEAATPVEQVVRDAWVATNSTFGRLNLGRREMLLMRIEEELGQFGVPVAATIGQFLGRFCANHDLALRLPDSPEDAAFFVGDPDFVQAVRTTLRTGRTPPGLEKHADVLSLCTKLEAGVRKAEKDAPLVVRGDNLSLPHAMSAGWVMSVFWPQHPLALLHGGQEVVCQNAIITPSARSARVLLAN